MKRLVLATAIILLAAACKPPEGDGTRGREGIISMVPGATEILFALGAGDRVVGVSDFCSHPPEVRKLPRYGGILNPSTERVVASGAEAIVLHESAHDLASAARQSGMQVVQVGTENLEQMDEAIDALGRLVGDEKRAAELKRTIHDQMREAASAAPQGRTPDVVMVVDRSPDDLKRIFVSGPHSLLNELVQMAGGRNVFEDTDRPYPMVSLETIVTREPDVIIDLRPLERGGEDAREAMKLWRGAGILAPQGPVGSVHVAETTEYTVYGPRLGAAVAMLVRMIHQEGP